MLNALLTFAAAEGEETSKTAFYVIGGLLAVWAVLVGGMGVMRHADFPGSAGARGGVMAITVLLVVATAASAVLTA